MRFIVEQKQTVLSRNTIVLSGCRPARRLTRFSSVPTAQAEPAGASSIVADDVLRRADLVGGAYDLVAALGMDEHVDAGDTGAYVLDGGQG